MNQGEKEKTGMTPLASVTSRAGTNLGKAENEASAWPLLRESCDRGRTRNMSKGCKATLSIRQKLYPQPASFRPRITRKQPRRRSSNKTIVFLAKCRYTLLKQIVEEVPLLLQAASYTSETRTGEL